MAIRAAFDGWRILAVLWAILFINLAFPMYGISVLVPYMAADLHLTRTDIGTTFAIFMAMTGIPGPLAAWFVGRFGARLTLFFGNVILVGGAAATAALVHTPLQLFLAAGVVIGTADAIGGPIAAQANITHWFVRRRSFALSVVLSGGAIGGFIAAPLLDYIATHASMGWRAGWYTMAGLGVVACILSLTIKNTPEELGQTPDGEPKVVAAPLKVLSPRPKSRVYITDQDWPPRDALRSPVLWLIMFAALGFSASLTLFLAQGIIHLEDLGHSASAAALALSVSVIVGLIANLAIGVAGDRIDPRYLWIGCLLIDAVGMLLLVKATSPFLMFFTAAILGLGGSGCMVCLVTLLGNFFGPRAYAAVFGMASAVQSTLGAVAPLIAGYWYDKHGSYTPIFLATSASCVIGAIVLLMISPPRE